MAGGGGSRLRPLTERWPKPVLPIDGRPVIATLLRELGAFETVFVVTGHLAGQVEELVGDGSAFGLEVRYARQPGVLGSADTVQRALAAGATPPFLVTAADTVYGTGDVRRFAEAYTGSGAPGALAVRREPAPDPPHRPAGGGAGGGRAAGGRGGRPGPPPPPPPPAPRGRRPAPPPGGPGPPPPPPEGGGGAPRRG